jgi:type I restriction enzyme, S subunit
VREGELPAGWAAAALADVVVASAPILYGILQPGPNLENGVLYVRPTEISDDKIQMNALRKTSEKIAAKYSRSLLAEGDIIMSMVGTIGKVVLVPAALAGGNITQSVQMSALLIAITSLGFSVLL